MRKWIIPLLVVALLVTGYYAYGQSRLNDDLIRRAEAQYQKSFHELVWGMDTMNSQLAQTLVTSSPEQIMSSLTNIWREAFGAQANLASIPVIMVELDKTQKLLDDIASYSYYLLKENNINQKKLTAKEWDKIQGLYDRSVAVCDDLSLMEASILNNNISFVDMETRALRRGENLTNHVIVDGFTNIENKVKSYPEMQFDEGIQKLEREPRPIAGKEITEEEALEIARNFFNKLSGPVSNVEMAFDANGKIPTYGISGLREETNSPTYVEVTKKGGHIIEMYTNRQIGEGVLEIEEGERVARDFLASMNLNNLELVEVNSNSQTAIFTFVPTEDGVLLYSDMVKAQVALDNGEILSFDQTSFLSYHHQRNIQRATLEAQEITVNMNPNFKILQTRLALVPNEFEDQEILAYEIKGQINNETFILFVDANTGEDVRVVRMTKPREYEMLVRG